MDKRFTKVTLLSIFGCKYIPQGTPGPVAGPKGEVCGPNLRNLAGNSWSFFLAQTSSLSPQETQSVLKEAQWSCLRRRLSLIHLLNIYLELENSFSVNIH